MPAEVIFLIVVALAVALYARQRLAAGARKPAIHVEYTLHAPVAGQATLAALTARLAELGRRVDVRRLRDDGEPGDVATGDTVLAGSQLELRLAGAGGPGRVLLRLRREADGSLFGLLEIDDDRTIIHRRVAADVVRELGALVGGLEFARLGAPDTRIQAKTIEAGESL